MSLTCKLYRWALLKRSALWEIQETIHCYFLIDMKGLPKLVIDWIIKNHDTVVSRMHVEAVFANAMLGLEYDARAKRSSLSAVTRRYFQIAALGGHEEAKWISPVLEAYKGNFEQIVSHCDKLQDNEKAQYIVWLKKVDDICLIRAASTNWKIPYSVLLIQQKTIRPSLVSAWLLIYGDRNWAHRFHSNHGPICLQQYDQHFASIPTAMWHPEKLCSWVGSQKSLVSWVPVFYSMHMASCVPLNLAELIVNHPHLLCTFSSLHEQSMFDFAVAMIYAGYAVSYVCSQLNHQFVAKYPERRLNAADIMTTAFCIFQLAVEKRKSAAITTLVVCKQYGCNADVCQMIYKMICRVSAKCWLVHRAPKSVKRARQK